MRARKPKGGSGNAKPLTPAAIALAAAYASMGGAKTSKYSAKKTVVDGVTLDSGHEAKRWVVLLQLQKAGLVKNLRRQVVYPLVEGVKLLGDKRARPAIRYVADFVYDLLVGNEWREVIEDSKGFDTPVAKIKRHLMKALLGLDVLIS